LFYGITHYGTEAFTLEAGLEILYMAEVASHYSGSDRPETLISSL